MKIKTTINEQSVPASIIKYFRTRLYNSGKPSVIVSHEDLMKHIWRTDFDDDLVKTLSVNVGYSKTLLSPLEAIDVHTKDKYKYYKREVWIVSVDNVDLTCWACLGTVVGKSISDMKYLMQKYPNFQENIYDIFGFFGLACIELPAVENTGLQLVKLKDSNHWVLNFFNKIINPLLIGGGLYTDEVYGITSKPKTKVLRSFSNA